MGKDSYGGAGAVGESYQVEYRFVGEKPLSDLLVELLLDEIPLIGRTGEETWEPEDST